MLPDILLGVFTGRDTVGLERQPAADSEYSGRSVRQESDVEDAAYRLGWREPAEQGGTRGAGKERTEGNRNAATTGREVQYRRYPDEPLNPRIVNPALQGCTLVATIDRVPCTVQLTPAMADAYVQEPLPLNTLPMPCSPSDKLRQMASQNHDNGQQETIVRTRAFNNPVTEKYGNMKEKIANRKECRGASDRAALHGFETKRRMPGTLAQRYGQGFPKFYPKGVAVSPFNGLFMALHSDRNGCKTNLFTLYSDAKARGTSVREHEQGVPFLFFNWNKYVHRNNPEDIISRDAYLKLDEEVQKQYKGIHNRRSAHFQHRPDDTALRG